MSVLTNIELVFWNLDKGNPPAIATVRQALSTVGLNAERAFDLPDSTAFRRACDAQKRKEETVKIFNRKLDGLLCAQFDGETQVDGVLRRSMKAQYVLSTEGELSLDRGDAIPEMHADYQCARETYTWADVSKVVQAVLEKDGLGAFSPRKGGGVYFVPLRPDALDLLDKLTTFCTSLGVRFLRYQVPDLSAQREEIADAIAASYGTGIEGHEVAIAAYTPTSKPGVLDNRREALRLTRESMARVGTLMNGRYAVLVARLLACEQALQTAEMAIASAATTAQQTARLAGRRQIAGLRND